MKDLRSDNLHGQCGACAFKKACGGCRARAWYGSGGDYMAEDPHCIMTGKQKTEEAQKC